MPGSSLGEQLGQWEEPFGLEQAETAIELLEEGRTKEDACAQAGISVRTLEYHCAQDPPLAARIEDAIETGKGALANKAFERGVRGWLELKKVGKQIVQVRRYDRKIFMRYLERMDPRWQPGAKPQTQGVMSRQTRIELDALESRTVMESLAEALPRGFFGETVRSLPPELLEHAGLGELAANGCVGEDQAAGEAERQHPALPAPGPANGPPPAAETP